MLTFSTTSARNSQLRPTLSSRVPEGVASRLKDGLWYHEDPA
jgi:hypothetical protein